MARAAVPSVIPAPPVATPRAHGERMRSVARIVRPKLAPSIPVSTHMAVT